MKYTTEHDSRSPIKKRLFIYLITTSAILYGLICFVFSPIYSVAVNNRVLFYSFLPTAMELLIELANITAFAVSFALIIYSMYKFNIGSSTMLIVSYCAASFLKYTANMLVSLFIFKVLSVDDLSDALTSFFLDTAVVLIVAIIVYGEKRRYLSAKNNMRNEIFPFKKIFSTTNPLQRASLKTGVLLAAIKVFTRIIYDISFPPSDLIDILWMVIHYAADIMITFIVYLISLLIFTKLNKKETAE